MILNKGNTCYLGAALQCIIRTDSLDRFVQQSIGQTNTEAILFYKIHTRVRGGVVCDPDELYKKIRRFYKPFDNMEQNDAHEAVLVILDYLYTFMTPIPNTLYVGSLEGRRSWGERYSVVDEIYKIQFENSIRCQNCNHVILNYECAYGLYDTFEGLGKHALPGYRCDRCHQTDTCSEYVSVSHYPQTLIIRARPTMVINQTKFRLGMNIYTVFAVCRYIPQLNNESSAHYNAGYLQECTQEWVLVDDDVATTWKNVDDILRNASVLFLQLE